MAVTGVQRGGDFPDPKKGKADTVSFPDKFLDFVAAENQFFKEDFKKIFKLDEARSLAELSTRAFSYPGRPQNIPVFPDSDYGFQILENLPKLNLHERNQGQINAALIGLVSRLDTANSFISDSKVRILSIVSMVRAKAKLQGTRKDLLDPVLHKLIYNRISDMINNIGDNSDNPIPLAKSILTEYLKHTDSDAEKEIIKGILTNLYNNEALPELLEDALYSQGQFQLNYQSSTIDASTFQAKTNIKEREAFSSLYEASLEEFERHIQQTKRIPLNTLPSQLELSLAAKKYPNTVTVKYLASAYGTESFEENDAMVQALENTLDQLAKNDYKDWTFLNLNEFDFDTFSSSAMLKSEVSEDRVRQLVKEFFSPDQAVNKFQNYMKDYFERSDSLTKDPNLDLFFKAMNRIKELSNKHNAKVAVSFDAYHTVYEPDESKREVVIGEIFKDSLSNFDNAFHIKLGTQGYDPKSFDHSVDPNDVYDVYEFDQNDNSVSLDCLLPLYANDVFAKNNVDLIETVSVKDETGETYEEERNVDFTISNTRDLQTQMINAANESQSENLTAHAAYDPQDMDIFHCTFFPYSEDDDNDGDEEHVDEWQPDDGNKVDDPNLIGSGKG